VLGLTVGLFSRRPKPTDLGSLQELETMLESGRPVFLDFFQFGCGPCKVMDGIVNELAEEYDGSAHIVKINVARVPGAVEVFSIRSTPTFVLLGPSPRKGGKVTARWRASGLVRKDQLQRVLESNGAVLAGD
jgi:thioredoxin 1